MRGWVSIKRKRETGRMVVEEGEVAGTTVVIDLVEESSQWLGVV